MLTDMWAGVMVFLAEILQLRQVCNSACLVNSGDYRMLYKSAETR